jgi:spore maturation protein CgeB
VLAARGFLLTEPWPEMENDFEIGKDLDIFTSVEELKKKIDYYLKNEDKAQEIAEHGYNTVQKFSRDNWAKRISEIFREVIIVKVT